MSLGLLTRSDAGSEIGTGHVMRCLALAQACQARGMEVALLSASPPPQLESRLRADKVNVLHLLSEPGSDDDARQTASLADQLGATWVAIDGYHFSSSYQRILKQSGKRLLLIDDLGLPGHYCADLIVNANLKPEETWYENREDYTVLLLGVRYAFLRREFQNWKDRKITIPTTARKILLTMGGGDSQNATLKVIEALQFGTLAGLEIKVIIGASNVHEETVKSAAKASRFETRVERNVGNMAEIMAWSDLAVTAGGATAYELAFMGVPSLTLILSENQKHVAIGLAEFGATFNLGWADKAGSAFLAESIQSVLVDQSLRSSMSQQARHLIDGDGTNRIAAALYTKV